MGKKKTTLTQAAEKLLEEIRQSTGDRIYNIAEKKVLDETRREINETDIRQAQKSVSITDLGSNRKWAIRLLIMATFALLGIQVSAFYQLFQYMSMHGLSVVVQAWLVLPMIFFLVLVIAFTWIFKDDWV